jgi:predicted phosphate transport protein (TIGR00153 family)
MVIQRPASARLCQPITTWPLHPGDPLMRLLPQDTVFFDLFDAQVEAVVESAAAFQRLAGDASRLAVEAQTLDDIEHRADEITHEIANRVHAMFVTPFDKEDISLLSGTLDDIVDYLEAAVSRMVLYRVGTPPPELVPLSHLIVEITDLLAQAVRGLRRLTNRDALHRLFVEIHRVENESDGVYREALSRLYDLPEPTPEALLHLMKCKEILDRLEISIDKCEDAANAVESIAVKYG